MPSVLHLFKAGDASLAVPVIARQIEAGDTVTVALVPGASAPPLPASVILRRMPDDLSYSQLLDLIFAADQVMAW